MTDIVLASNNKKKITELESMLSFISGDIRVLSLKDIGYTGDIDEYGSSFDENSIIKAAVPASLGYIGIADDSGLCVDALGGAPGVYSARYAGEHGDDGANRRRLIEELRGIPVEKRGAGFVCVASVVIPENSGYTIPKKFCVPEELRMRFAAGAGAAGFTRGECRGFILEEERGDGGFGYDSLFYSPELRKSFGEASAEEKNGISHRGRAMKEFVKLIELVINQGKG